MLWLYGKDHLVTEVGTMNVFIYIENDKGGKRASTILHEMQPTIYTNDSRLFRQGLGTACQEIGTCLLSDRLFPDETFIAIHGR